MPNEMETWYTKYIRGIRAPLGASQTWPRELTHVSRTSLLANSVAPRHFHLKIVRPFECLFPRSRAMTRFHRSVFNRRARVSARHVLQTLLLRLARIAAHLTPAQVWRKPAPRRIAASTFGFMIGLAILMGLAGAKG